jgi:hypothetical protein
MPDRLETMPDKLTLSSTPHLAPGGLGVVPDKAPSHSAVDKNIIGSPLARTLVPFVSKTSLINYELENRETNSRWTGGRKI